MNEFERLERLIVESRDKLARYIDGLFITQGIAMSALTDAVTALTSSVAALTAEVSTQSGEITQLIALAQGAGVPQSAIDAIMAAKTAVDSSVATMQGEDTTIGGVLNPPQGA